MVESWNNCGRKGFINSMLVYNDAQYQYHDFNFMKKKVDESNEEGKTRESEKK